MRGPDLLRVAWIRRALVSRWPQLLVQLAVLAVFAVVVVAGLTGSPVGNRNAGIVLVWIVWWALLVLVGVPLLGRGWCSVCPIPLPGEWLQRGAVLGPSGCAGGRGLGRRWPRRLRNLWVQNAGFVLLALLSARILTDPLLTAAVLGAFLVLATATALVYERRAFCRYLCPVGGFIGLYSQAAPVELRVRDRAVCACHRPKTCYVGGAGGHGCPWGVFPGSLDRNTYCGLCLECLRGCPEDNVAVRLRWPAVEIGRPRTGRLDEAFKALILTGAALAYSAVMLGPWGLLKRAAFEVGSTGWWLYALGLVTALSVLLPGALLAAIWLAERPLDGPTLRRRFVESAQALVPLGLAAWAAFTLSFALSSVSYVWPVLSDPLGRGQDLLGTAGVGWRPDLDGHVPMAVVLVLLAGLAWTCAVVRRSTGAPASGSCPSVDRPAPVTAWRRVVPVVGLSVSVTVGLLWLLVG